MRTRRSPSLPEDEENDGREHDNNGNDPRHQLNDSSPDTSRARPPRILPLPPPQQPLLQRMQPPSLHARKGTSLDTASMNETTIRTSETASLLQPRSRTTTTTAPSSLPQSPARGSPTVPLAGTANVNDTQRRLVRIGSCTCAYLRGIHKCGSRCPRMTWTMVRFEKFTCPAVAA
jgi:hypothetical protein